MRAVRPGGLLRGQPGRRRVVGPGSGDGRHPRPGGGGAGCGRRRQADFAPRPRAEIVSALLKQTAEKIDRVRLRRRGAGVDAPRRQARALAPLRGVPAAGAAGGGSPLPAPPPPGRRRRRRSRARGLVAAGDGNGLAAYRRPSWRASWCRREAWATLWAKPRAARSAPLRDDPSCSATSQNARRDPRARGRRPRDHALLRVLDACSPPDAWALSRRAARARAARRRARRQAARRAQGSRDVASCAWACRRHLAGLARVGAGDGSRDEATCASTNATLGVLALLVNRYPRVRRVAAEQLYVTLLGCEGEDAGAEAAVELLSATRWDADLAAVKPARNALYPMLGLETPKQALVAAKAKAANREAKDNDPYAALVGSAVLILAPRLGCSSAKVVTVNHRHFPSPPSCPWPRTCRMPSWRTRPCPCAPPPRSCPAPPPGTSRAAPPSRARRRRRGGRLPPAARRRRLSRSACPAQSTGAFPHSSSARAPRRARGAAARPLAGPSRRRVQRRPCPGVARVHGQPRFGAVQQPEHLLRVPLPARLAEARGGNGRAPRGRCSRGPRRRARAKAIAWVGRAHPRRARARAREVTARGAFPRDGASVASGNARSSPSGTPAAIARAGRIRGCAAREGVARTRRAHAKERGARAVARTVARGWCALGARGPICPVAMRCSSKTLLQMPTATTTAVFLLVERFSFLSAFPRRVRGPKNCLFPRKKAAQIDAF